MSVTAQFSRYASESAHDDSSDNIVKFFALEKHSEQGSQTEPETTQDVDIFLPRR